MKMFNKVTHNNESLNLQFLNQKPYLPLDIQFFAEGGEGSGEGQGQGEGAGTGEGEGGTGEGEGQGGDDDTTFTQSDLDSAVSKAVETAIKNKRKEFEKEKEQAIADAKKDATEYSKLTKQQQQDRDFQKRMEKLEERERELNLRQLRSEVEGDLKEQGLPAEFASSLITLEDNEKIKKSIESIKKTFDEAVNASVKEQLRQDTPKSQNGNNDAKNPWKKGQINLTEQAKIYKEDPAKAKLLMEQAK